MIRHNAADLNTASHYDAIFFGPRTSELLAQPAFVESIRSLMSALARPEDRRVRVLDIGCGVGRYFDAFGDVEIFGTELSPKARDVASSIQGVVEIVNWRAGDPLPFADSFFDFVWCAEFLEHVEDPHGVVAEVKRVIGPRGVAMFVTPYMDAVPCAEHLWFFDEDDIKGMFDEGWRLSAVTRFALFDRKDGERIVAIAEKGVTP